MPKRPSLKINAISSWGPLGINLIVGLFLTPFIVHTLGKTDYGIWALVGSFLGYYGILRLGIDPALMRYIPLYTSRGDQESTSRVVSTALVLFATIGLSILIISILAAESIAKFYNAGSEFVTLVKIMGAAASVECLMRVFDACVRARERWVAANIVTMLAAILRALGLAACVYFGFGLKEMGYVVLGTMIFSLFLMFSLFRKTYHDIKLNLLLAEFRHVRLLVSFGLFTTVITIAWSLTLQGHNLIIGKLISMEAVSFYAIAGLLIKNARAAIIAPNRVYWPRFAQLDGDNDLKKIRSLLLRSTRYNTIFSSLIMALIIVAGPMFIRLWMGDGFEKAYWPLKILAIGYLIETSFAVIPSLMGGTGRQHIQAFMAVTEGLIGIVISIVLTWKLGLPGAALGFTVSIAIIRGFACPVYICRIYGIKIIEYYWSVLKSWLLVALFFLITIFADFSDYIGGWLNLIGFVLLFGCLYTLCLYFLVLSKVDKDLARALVMKIIVFFKRVCFQ